MISKEVERMISKEGLKRVAFGAFTSLSSHHAEELILATARQNPFQIQGLLAIA